ncbi:hypothetical protein N7463_002229 [Penicillium fimorum]|uniref:Uncharacterized protein n=1 Tax=Penicillium fimorum TaxID=1882269 RepID=A0A9W9XYU1_9EURO|nr:hypothetical protein N7463_002229 [Penicillium fimorum]
MTVSCEGLLTPQVEFGFGIRRSPAPCQTWMVPPKLITLPNTFFDDLDITSEMVRTSNPSSRNEQQARILITMLLTGVYKELRRLPYVGPNDIRMFQETTFKFYPMKFMDKRKVRQVHCVGRTDFSFYFGDHKAQAINLVIIEAKPTGLCGTGEGQTLAYMVME